MRVQESRENYLEAILMLQKKHGYVRSVDVANHLNFSRPSVSVAMANLRSLGPVSYTHLSVESVTVARLRIASTCTSERVTLWMIDSICSGVMERALKSI